MKTRLRWWDDTTFAWILGLSLGLLLRAGLSPGWAPGAGSWIEGQSRERTPGLSRIPTNGAVNALRYQVADLSPRTDRLESRVRDLQIGLQAQRAALLGLRIQIHDLSRALDELSARVDGRASRVETLWVRSWTHAPGARNYEYKAVPALAQEGGWSFVPGPVAARYQGLGMILLKDGDEIVGGYAPPTAGGGPGS